MMIMRTTPGIIKATEKYIASLSRKREELTEEQWDFMVNCIKTRRLVIPVLIITVILFISTTSWNWHLGRKYFTQVIPHGKVTISFEDKSEPMMLSPKEIRDYFRYTINRYMGAFGGFLTTLIVLIPLILIVGTNRGGNRVHRILLSRPTAKE